MIGVSVKRQCNDSADAWDLHCHQSISFGIEMQALVIVHLSAAYWKVDA